MSLLFVFVVCFISFFFFKQKTAYEMRISDWSSDVCSSDLTAPVLVIQGEGDEYGTIAQVDSIARRVKGPVETLLLPGCGHSPHREIGRASCRERVCQYV